MRRQCYSCCSAYSAVDVQRGEVDVVAMDAKILSSETAAEPCSIVIFTVVVAAVNVVVALLLFGSSNVVCWELAFAIQASSKEHNPADACARTATAVAWGSKNRVPMPLW